MPVWAVIHNQLLIIYSTRKIIIGSLFNKGFHTFVRCSRTYLLKQAIWTPPVVKLGSIMSSSVVDSGSIFGLLGSDP